MYSLNAFLPILFLGLSLVADSSPASIQIKNATSGFELPKKITDMEKTSGLLDESLRLKRNPIAEPKKKPQYNYEQGVEESRREERREDRRYEEGRRDGRREGELFEERRNYGNNYRRFKRSPEPEPQYYYSGSTYGGGGMNGQNGYYNYNRYGNGRDYQLQMGQMWGRRPVYRY